MPGYGGALRTGFQAATGNYVLTLDADGSHDPSFLSQMWESRESAEVVVASRYVAGGAAEMSPLRSVLSRVLNLTFRRGLSLPVHDLSSGYRLYHRAAVRGLKIQATNFDVLEEILIRTLAAGYTVREIPFHYRARMSGESHVRLARFAISYMRTLGSMWRLRNSIESADYDGRAYDSVVPLQRYWQRRRYQIVTRLTEGFKDVLDVGCGSSRILGSRAMVGLDIMMHKLRYGRRFGNPLVHGSIFELPFPDASFDCVICSEVIEHVPADEKVFSELERVLRPGGRLILGTPDYDRWQWRTLEWLYGKLAPSGYADEHITHYCRDNLQRYLEARGMKVESVDYVGGSEMIFSLRKSAVPAPVKALPPVTSGLRTREQPVRATSGSRPGH
jgi:dolichol-phosphate mannosyltransferase